MIYITQRYNVVAVHLRSDTFHCWRKVCAPQGRNGGAILDTIEPPPVREFHRPWRGTRLWQQRRLLHRGAVCWKRGRSAAQAI